MRIPRHLPPGLKLLKNILPGGRAICFIRPSRMQFFTYSGVFASMLTFYFHRCLLFCSKQFSLFWVSVSFMWRSIMEGHKLLKQSLYWRIGNGRKVKVRKETWLMTPYEFKLQKFGPIEARSWYKVSVDGAFKSNGAGAGVVVRDDVGEITATTAMRLHGIKDANHAEIMALWSGVILARELMFSNLIIEPDCSPT
ncbi:hypothetical protein M9H77_14035 [Catharanthus roseus]|uniref:Uncharacterized protein n=1 Tax=Catharanthus roseus TaxID=4058 RepID=A0ACC0BM08_CATRO|nr:hypothetical protein M9H77_14035 [Catharanthus roseus]